VRREEHDLNVLFSKAKELHDSISQQLENTTLGDVDRDMLSEWLVKVRKAL